MQFLHLTNDEHFIHVKILSFMIKMTEKSYNDKIPNIGS